MNFIRNAQLIIIERMKMIKIASLNLENFYDLPCHVYWKDKKGIYRGSNDYHVGTGGVKGSDFIGHTDKDITMQETAMTLLQNDHHVIATNRAFTVVEEVKFGKHFNQEREYAVLSFKQPWYNKKNCVMGVMGLSVVLNEDRSLPPFFDHTQLFPPVVLLPPIKHTKKHQKNTTSHPLTRRQLDCLYYLVQGKTAKQIAGLLHLSYRTVEHHISAIKTKYGCGSRSELIETALNIPFIKQALFSRHGD